MIYYEKHIKLNKSHQNESFDKFKHKNEGNPYRDHCDGSSPEGEWKGCLAFSLKLSWKREKKLIEFTTTMESTCNAGDEGDTGSAPGLGRSPGGGNGNPLQYSCLKNPKDRGPWRATVQRVTKSWT